MDTNLPVPPVPPPTYTAKQAAAALGISKNSFYAHRRAGHIPHIRIGKKILVPAHVIDNLLRCGMPANLRQPVDVPNVRLPPAALPAPAPVGEDDDNPLA